MNFCAISVKLEEIHAAGHCPHGAWAAGGVQLTVQAHSGLLLPFLRSSPCLFAFFFSPPWFSLSIMLLQLRAVHFKSKEEQASNVSQE